jgi:hypothetical protein
MLHIEKKQIKVENGSEVVILNLNIIIEERPHIEQDEDLIFLKQQNHLNNL